MKLVVPIPNMYTHIGLLCSLFYLGCNFKKVCVCGVSALLGTFTLALFCSNSCSHLPGCAMEAVSAGVRYVSAPLATQDSAVL